MNNEKVYNNILEVIGKTPMVKINRIHKDYGLECEFFAKCEFFNPGGSIKDRISVTMVEDYEAREKVHKDSMFVEPTSGNTGIGVALVTACKGYGCTIVTPDKNSGEKMDTIKLLGGNVIQTPADALYGTPDNFMSVIHNIFTENPNAVSCDQYKNRVNVDTHYHTTAEEILSAVPELDMVVIGTGTGGTASGVGKKIKERRPQCVVVAVDPEGSTIFGEGTPKQFFVEGIGGDFIPDVVDKTVIDKVEHPNDAESFNMAREVIRKEGLLCGGSSGAAMYAAISAAKDLKFGADKKIVVILADGIRNYMTKFVTDQWMEAHLFKEPPTRNSWWWNRAISNLNQITDVPRVLQHQSCSEALTAMGSKHTVAFVLNGREGYLKGIVTKDHLRHLATNPLKNSPDFDEVVSKTTWKKYHKIVENDRTATVGLVSRILDITPFVVVVELLRGEKDKGNYIPKSIITPEIVLEYILSQKHQDK